MLKKIVGILAFLAFLSFTSISSLLMSQGSVMFEGALVQFAFANLTFLVVFCGFHLIETHCEAPKLARMTIWSLGLILLIYGILSSFDVISIKDNWNYVLSLAIIFITIIQLQLLKWEKSKSVLKILGLLTILSNVFLVIYLFAQLSMRSLAVVVDIAVITSVFAFLFGLVLSRKRKQKVPAAQA